MFFLFLPHIPQSSEYLTYVEICVDYFVETTNPMVSLIGNYILFIDAVSAYLLDLASYFFVCELLDHRPFRLLVSVMSI